MNDANSFGYGESTGVGAAMGPGVAGRAAAGGPNMGQYKFSPDELRVLQECNRESFFQRSLPLSALFGFGTYTAVSQGHLRPNPRFGAFPKVTLAVAIGYFIGKLSYQQACAEKLMALPGSYIGQLLRDRRDGKIEGTSMPPVAPGSMLGAEPADVYSDAGPGSALNLDTDRPSSLQPFSDESYKPNQDSPTQPAPAGPRSYDELRRLNRGEHDQQKQDPYRVEPRRAPPPPRAAPAPAPPLNRYGDAME